MTDQEWLDSLPPDAEFICPGYYLPGVGVRCRVSQPDPDDPPPLGPGMVWVEAWAGSAGWVAVSDLRGWPRWGGK